MLASMRTIPREEVLERLKTENPWWSSKPPSIGRRYNAMPRRPYLRLFLPLVRDTSVRRAVVLMGPRRVGKTVLIHHAIQELIDTGLDSRHVCYISVDHPLYNGWGLHQLVQLFVESNQISPEQRTFIFFDEIQYLKNWELHLKTLVDGHTEMRFIVSGSAAAALRLKSSESGAGRFTDFLLPPLTFYEYLELLNKTAEMDFSRAKEDEEEVIGVKNVDVLNAEFLKYLNYGGYPEVIFSEEIQADPGRFIKADIIDKVLLRDLPSLYGITDIQELNQLFTTLAYNSAQEVSLEQLSQSSGVAKNTLKRYIEYLEAAFLLKLVHRIDHNAKRFQRANFFKVYLTNPSLRAALFSPIKPEDERMGSVAETGIFSQWFHSDVRLHYARWKNGQNQGEVDIVNLDNAKHNPRWAVEVKWSDRFFDRPYELGNLISFCKANRLADATVTTISKEGFKKQDDVDLEFTPASLYCYQLGYNIIRSKKPPTARQVVGS